MPLKREPEPGETAARVRDQAAPAFGMPGVPRMAQVDDVEVIELGEGRLRHVAAREDRPIMTTAPYELENGGLFAAHELDTQGVHGDPHDPTVPQANRGRNRTGCVTVGTVRTVPSRRAAATLVLSAVGGRDAHEMQRGTNARGAAQGGAADTRPRPRLAIGVFTAWTVGVVLLQVAGYADTRARRDLLTLIAEAGVGALAFAAWRAREPLSRVLDGIGARGVARFVAAGLVGTYVSEAFFYAATLPGMPLPRFLLRTLVWYAGWLAAWWWLCRRHGLSVAQVFFLGGLNGFLVEGLVLRPVPLTPLGLLLYPAVASVYGAALTIPRLLIEPGPPPASDLTPLRRFGLSLVPLAAFVPGMAWMVLVDAVLGVSR